MRNKSKRGIRSKRGISTVVASILVLAITVALAVGLLTFGSSFMGSTEKMQPPTTDQIKVESVHFDSTTNTITVTVRNVGLSDVSIDQLYVDGASVDIGGATSITHGTAGQVSGSFTATSGHAYTIKVASANGGESTYTAIYNG